MAHEAAVVRALRRGGSVRARAQGGSGCSSRQASHLGLQSGIDDASLPFRTNTIRWSSTRR